jgi:hypothetical protein
MDTLNFAFDRFFALSMMSLAFLISVFFSKAKLAGIVGPIVCFALIMPRYAFLTTDDDEQLGAKFFLCIFSPTAYAFAMDDYMLYEGAQVGINNRNAGAEPISVSAMIAFMFFDMVRLYIRDGCENHSFSIYNCLRVEGICSSLSLFVYRLAMPFSPGI